MLIPLDWLVDPTTLEEVEDDLASCGDLCDLWLEEWAAFLERFEPGDELWEYAGEARDTVEPAADASPGQDALGWDYHGFARVREGEILDSIPRPE